MLDASWPKNNFVNGQASARPATAVPEARRRFWLGVGVQSRPIWRSEERRKLQGGRAAHTRRAGKPIQNCLKMPPRCWSICAQERGKSCCWKPNCAPLSGRRAASKAASPMICTAAPNCLVLFSCTKCGPAASIIAFTRKHAISCVGMPAKTRCLPRATPLFGSRSASTKIKRRTREDPVRIVSSPAETRNSPGGHGPSDRSESLGL